MENFKNFSTWNEKNIVIEQGEMFTVDYVNIEAPNMFAVINPDNAELKISISKIPTPDKYEFIIQGASHDVFGRPTRTRQLYILNDSTVRAHVKIFSTYDKFNINILKAQYMSVSTLKTVFDGICRGFASNVMLPSGTNTIGKIEAGEKLNDKIDDIIANQTDTFLTFSQAVTDISRKLDNLSIDIADALSKVSIDVNLPEDNINVTIDSIGDIPNEEGIPLVSVVGLPELNIPDIDLSQIDLSNVGLSQDTLNNFYFEDTKSELSFVELPLSDESLANTHGIKIPVDSIDDIPLASPTNRRYEINTNVTELPIILDVKFNKNLKGIYSVGLQMQPRSGGNYHNFLFPNCRIIKSTDGIIFYRHVTTASLGIYADLGFYPDIFADEKNIGYHPSSYLDIVPMMFSYHITPSMGNGFLADVNKLKTLSDMGGCITIPYGSMNIGNGTTTIYNYLKIQLVVDKEDSGTLVKIMLADYSSQTYLLTKDCREIEFHANITMVTLNYGAIKTGAVGTQTVKYNIIGGFM